MRRTKTKKLEARQRKLDVDPVQELKALKEAELQSVTGGYESFMRCGIGSSSCCGD